jgi:hypothetical protein
VLAKIEKAGSKELFYLCMALARGIGKKLDPEQLPKFSDLVYSLYIGVAQNIKSYDLYQLG